jgi:hypothetical protein
MDECLSFLFPLLSLIIDFYEQLTALQHNGGTFGIRYGSNSKGACYSKDM